MLGSLDSKGVDHQGGLISCHVVAWYFIHGPGHNIPLVLTPPPPPPPPPPQPVCEFTPGPCMQVWRDSLHTTYLWCLTPPPPPPPSPNQSDFTPGPCRSGLRACLDLHTTSLWCLTSPPPPPKPVCTFTRACLHTTSLWCSTPHLLRSPSKHPLLRSPS